MANYRLLKKRGDCKARPVVLRCLCGTELQAINGGGETFLHADRTCASCKRGWRVRLDIAGWEKDLPSYKLGAIAALNG